ncbi:hypothetical protein LCGC14_1865390 [marine sediment metagenome]|uniref:Uncharacterized protein n=1 Tax=marine sediment metagenome TaxID=412755 RepID=A0A0F9G6N6_9ZZZZ
MEKCKNCERLEKLLKIHIDDLRKSVEMDKELKEALTKITTAIVSEKVKKPKNLYEFRPDGIFEEKDLAVWFDYTSNFYHFAKRYEKQERGFTCHVDRAYRDWLIPECKKLLDKLKEVSLLSSHA